ncbi:uncharacterized protein LOC128951231 [Oppia nitens]|uniref:uncharacterized protein LOC128951231 n=1 Tax=Oppia nitens TaxID=1686743 RepID=UPI0023DBB8AA|nr:uncharacterized protein LOC128951231 [Oppia nitens]
MSDDEFKDNFRVTRKTFSYLLDNLKVILSPKGTSPRASIPVDKKIAISLKVLATNCEYREIGIIFGVGKSTVCHIFKSFITAVTSILSKHIKFPSDEEFRQMAIDFEQLWQYPMAIGAIDGCHFCINAPLKQSTDYYNYKNFKSVVALAICDANYKVWYLKTGIPGRTNDSGAFRETKLFKDLESGVLPKDTRVFGGSNIPYHLLGDGAFALKEWLIKPFIYRDSAPSDQLLFNRRHSRARRVIENTFGRIKGRWRRLSKKLEVKIEDAGKVIHTAFILHNICEEHRDVTKTEWLRDITHITPRRRIDVNPINMDSANVIRNSLKDFFLSQTSQPWNIK